VLAGNVAAVAVSAEQKRFEVIPLIPRERTPVRKAGEKEDMSKSYVIEVGDDQAGLVIREDGEREYLFHAALDAYSALDGRRFANAFLAERAAIAHAASRRRRRNAGAEFLAR
jgi:hypothetical protein